MRDGIAFIAIVVLVFVGALIAIFINSMLPTPPVPASSDFCEHHMNGRYYVFPNEEKAASRCECDDVIQYIDKTVRIMPNGTLVDITNHSASAFTYWDNCHLLDPNMSSVSSTVLDRPYVKGRME